MSTILEDIGDCVEIFNYEVDPPEFFKATVGKRVKLNNNCGMFSNLKGIIDGIEYCCEDGTKVFVSLDIPAKHSPERERIESAVPPEFDVVNNQKTLKLLLEEVIVSIFDVEEIEEVVFEGVICRRPVHYY